MSRTVLFLFLLLSASALISPCVAQEDSGWIAKSKPMLAESLDGWKCYPNEFASDWSVTDGVLNGESKNRESYLTWTGGGEFRNFDIRLEYRIRSEEANSGLQLRCKLKPERNDHPLVGYQADFGHLELGENVVGAWDFHGVDRGDVFAKRGERVVYGKNGERTIAKIEEAVQAEDLSSDGWNELRVHAYGDRLTYYLNGKIASEVIDNELGKKIDRGYFGLQLSRGQDMRIQFRSLRVRNLDAVEKNCELLESVRLKKGLAEQGLAVTNDDYFVSDYRAIYRYDQQWSLVAEQEIKIPGVNHVGAIDYHDGFLWAGMLQGPVDGKHNPAKNRGIIAKIDASDLSVVRTWDVSKEMTWIDPVCYDGELLYVGDNSDQGIHIYRVGDDELSRVRTIRYPRALNFSQGLRVADDGLYSIHTFGSEKGLFRFSLDGKPGNKKYEYPNAVWRLKETGMQHLEGFDFVSGNPGEIWHAQGKQVDRYAIGRDE